MLIFSIERPHQLQSALSWRLHQKFSCPSLMWRHLLANQVFMCFSLKASTNELSSSIFTRSKKFKNFFYLNRPRGLYNLGLKVSARQCFIWCISKQAPLRERRTVSGEAPQWAKLCLHTALVLCSVCTEQSHGMLMVAPGREEEGEPPQLTWQLWPNGSRYELKSLYRPPTSWGRSIV